MPSKCSPKSDADQPTVYQIRIEGHLSRQRMDWFEGLIIMLEEDDNTLIAGTVIDQSALHGILKKVRDSGMPLLSAHSVENGTPDASDSKLPPLKAVALADCAWKARSFRIGF